MKMNVMESIYQRSPVATTICQLRQLKTKSRRNVTLFNLPGKTTRIFLKIVWHQIKNVLVYIFSHKWMSMLLLNVFVLGVIMKLLGIWTFAIVFIKPVLDEMYFVLFWICLGALSTVGLGTGLHTFFLYLTPRVILITMAVQQCSTLTFHFNDDNDLICDPPSNNSMTISNLSILWILWKETFFWGLGTAIGELPPYFVARAAKISGEKVKIFASHNVKTKKRDIYSNNNNNNNNNVGSPPTIKKKSNMNMIEEKKKKITTFAISAMNFMLKKTGFWGIFLFASIPNPFFDIAGLTCGHFMVPFSTFFGGTVLGKACIKSFLQVLGVIFLIRQDHVLLSYIMKLESKLPFLQGKLVGIINMIKHHHHPPPHPSSSSSSYNFVGLLWNIFLFSMVGYFIVSLINSTVQMHLLTEDEKHLNIISRHRRKERERINQELLSTPIHKNYPTKKNRINHNFTLLIFTP